MTDQAIYIERVAKVVICVAVSIAGMALCAAWLIGCICDTEVVDQVILTDYLTFEPNNLVSSTSPREVSGIKHFHGL